MIQGPTIYDVIDFRLQHGCPTCEGPLARGPSEGPGCSPDCPLHCPTCGWEMWVVTEDALACEPGD